MNARISYAFAALALLSGPALAAGPEPKTEEEKTLYALGLAVSNNLASFKLTDADLGFVTAGLADGAQGKPRKVDLEAYRPKIQELQRTRLAAAAGDEKKAGKEYADKAAAEKGAARTTTGIVYSTIKAGSGASPKATDTVMVHYHGTLVDGKVFDSSVKRGKPISLALNQVIPCWTEGVQRMKVGEKARLVCPSDLAYGDAGRPPTIPPGATLIFEVELLEIGAK
jgi:FKBP-type peptidyl-prolyl cis-trans isomerase FkpA